MKIIEIQEEVVLDQNDKKIILEKGDRIRVLEREVSTYKAPKGKSWDAVVKELKRQGAKPGKDYDLIGSENFWVSYEFDSLELQKILNKTSESKINEDEVTVKYATQKTRHGWLYNPKDSNFNFMPTLTYPSEPRLVLVQLKQDPKWKYTLFYIAKGKHILKKINYYDSQGLIRNFDNIFPAYSLDVYDLWGLDGREEFLK